MTHNNNLVDFSVPSMLREVKFMPSAGTIRVKGSVVLFAQNVSALKNAFDNVYGPSGGMLLLSFAGVLLFFWVLFVRKKAFRSFNACRLCLHNILYLMKMCESCSYHGVASFLESQCPSPSWFGWSKTLKEQLSVTN